MKGFIRNLKIGVKIAILSILTLLLMSWVIGIGLMVGGVLGFLPILGFWMIPLGLLVLAPDFRWARRGYLTIMTWLRRYRDRQKPKTKTIEEQE